MDHSRLNQSHLLRLSDAYAGNGSNGSLVDGRENSQPSAYVIIFMNIYLTLTSVAGSLGNLLVIITLCVTKLYKNNTSYIYIGNLAIADLLVCVVVMPYSLFTLNSRTPLFACDVIGFVTIILCYVSIVSLAVIALNRYFLFTWPNAKHKSTYTQTRVIKSILVTWLVCFLLVCPLLVGFGQTGFNARLGSCFFPDNDRLSYIYILVVGHCIVAFPSLGLCAFAYTWIILIYRRSPSFLVNSYSCSSLKVAAKKTANMRSKHALEQNMLEGRVTRQCPPRKHDDVTEDRQCHQAVSYEAVRCVHDDGEKLQMAGNGTKLQMRDNGTNLQMRDNGTKLQMRDNGTLGRTPDGDAQIQARDDDTKIQARDDDTQIQENDEEAHIQARDDNNTNVQTRDDDVQVQARDVQIQAHDDEESIQSTNYDVQVQVHVCEDDTPIQAREDDTHSQACEDDTPIQACEDDTPIPSTRRLYSEPSTRR